MLISHNCNLLLSPAVNGRQAGYTWTGRLSITTTNTLQLYYLYFYLTNKSDFCGPKNLLDHFDLQGKKFRNHCDSVINPYSPCMSTVNLCCCLFFFTNLWHLLISFSKYAIRWGSVYPQVKFAKITFEIRSLYKLYKTHAFFSHCLTWNQNKLFTFLGILGWSKFVLFAKWQNNEREDFKDNFITFFSQTF